MGARDLAPVDPIQESLEKEAGDDPNAGTRDRGDEEGDDHRLVRPREAERASDRAGHEVPAIELVPGTHGAGSPMHRKHAGQYRNAVRRRMLPGRRIGLR